MLGLNIFVQVENLRRRPSCLTSATLPTVKRNVSESSKDFHLHDCQKCPVNLQSVWDLWVLNEYWHCHRHYPDCLPIFTTLFSILENIIAPILIIVKKNVLKTSKCLGSLTINQDGERETINALQPYDNICRPLFVLIIIIVKKECPENFKVFGIFDNQSRRRKGGNQCAANATFPAET